MLNKDKQVFIQAPYAKDKCLYYFEAVVLKERQVDPMEKTTISSINTLKDYTIWHQRLGHANQGHQTTSTTYKGCTSINTNW